MKSGKYTCCNQCSVKRRVKKTKTYNNFEVDGEYGIGYAGDITFKFDLDDYEKIKHIKWCKHSSGYISGYFKNNHYELLHRFVMNADKNVIIDHINHDKTDNRKLNLRIADYSKNGMNKKYDNRSVYPGVRFHKKQNNWSARIQVNYNPIHLGTFTTMDEAIKARKEAEDKYYGEFSYRKSVSERIVNE